MSTNPTARVTRRFAVAPERVFDAWLDPALIGRWMFGPALREEEVLRISVDARVGGAFSFLVRRQGMELDHVGTYLALERPLRLVFTWGVGSVDPSSQVTVEVVPAPDGGCEVRLAHEMAPQWAEFVPQGEAAWAKMLGALAGVLEG